MSIPIEPVNPIDSASNFIQQLQKNEPNFLQTCQRAGLDCYERLVAWLSDPGNQDKEDYDSAVCYVFSLIAELEKKKVINNKSELSNRAVQIIRSSRQDLDPLLDQFLQHQYCS